MTVRHNANRRSTDRSKMPKEKANKGGIKRKTNSKKATDKAILRKFKQLLSKLFLTFVVLKEKKKVWKSILRER